MALEIILGGVCMNRYKNARNKVAEWQSGFCDHNYLYIELAYYGEYFSRLASLCGFVRDGFI